MSNEDHNNIYRGQNLISQNLFYSIDYLQQAVKNGEFEDIYIGDYILYNDKKYIVMGINTYKDKNVVFNNSNHLVIVPENIMGQCIMSGSGLNTMGYLNTEIFYVLPQERYYGEFQKAFNNHILTGCWTLTGSGGSTLRSAQKIRLLNEMAVFGQHLGGAAIDDGEMGAQLPGFKLREDLRIKRLNGHPQYWWLSAIYSRSPYSFCQVSPCGFANRYDATGTAGVVPMILFG